MPDLTPARTWSLPDEPTPDVQELTDRYGRTWRRHERGWELPRETSPFGWSEVWPWATLLAMCSPLAAITRLAQETP